MRVLVLLTALSMCACVLKRFEPEGVHFLEVKLVTPADGDRGTPEARLPTPRGSFPVRVAVTALDRDGQPMDCAPGHACFEGLVSFGVSPGWLPVPDPHDAERVVPAHRGEVTLKLAAGRGEIALDLNGVFADVHVWAEEWPEVVDGVERPARYAAGVSESLYFKNPTVQDIQFDAAQMAPACADDRTCDNTSSPLVGNFVETSHSEYLVTGITNDGFFVSDLSTQTSPEIGDYPGRFHSLFVYNFSYPENLVTGDIVTRIYGTVQEFTGQTQLTFPAWDKQAEATTLEQGYTRRCDAENACPDALQCEQGSCRLQPARISENICARAQGTRGPQNLCGHSSGNIDLESLESGRVELTEAFMPTKFVNCDFNGDGDTPNENPTLPCGDECACKKACLEEDGCSELSALHTYGQYSVTLAGPKKYKINIVTRDSSPTVVPYQPAQEDAASQPLVYGGVKVRVRGNLRQTLPARPRWTVAVGERADFCCLEEESARCREIPPCQ